MLCYSANVLIRKSISIPAISTSFILAKQFSFSSNIPSFLLGPPSVPTRFLRSSSPPIYKKQRPLFFTLRSEHTMASQSTKQSIHDFTVKDARGNDVDLSIYKGKVLLIVNVASQCGLTNSNYTELSQLYEKYKNQGQVWRFWHFHAISLVHRSQEVMKRYWSLLALASRLNIPFLIRLM